MQSTTVSLRARLLFLLAAGIFAGGGIVPSAAKAAGTTTLAIDPAAGNAGAVAELIAAIVAANGDAAANTIELFPGGMYTFTAPDNFEYGPNALPQVASDVTLEGQGATIARSVDGAAVAVADLVNDQRDGSNPNASNVDLGPATLVMAVSTVNGATTIGVPVSSADPNLGPFAASMRK